MDDIKFNEIEEYLDNSLSKEELNLFEQDLLSDETLQDELNLHEEVNAAIMEQDVVDLREKLQTIGEKHRKREDIKTIIFNRWNMVAASFILFFTLGGYLFFNNRPYTNDQIYKTYFEPYGIIGTTRSSDADNGSLMSEALKNYEAKNYRTAAALFQQILRKDSTNITGNFYSGISNLEINRYINANKNFNRVISHNDNLFIEQSEWYLGFCHLMNGNRTKAIHQFTVIANKDGFYKDKAAKILKRIKEQN